MPEELWTRAQEFDDEYLRRLLLVRQAEVDELREGLRRGREDAEKLGLILPEE